MFWLTDDSTPVFVICGITLLVLLVFLLKTGRGVIMLAMAGVVLCIVAAILIDMMVVTDREVVEQTLFKAANLAEQNQFEALLDYVSPSVPHVRAQAASWIHQASRIDEVGISAIDITVNRTKHPPTARAEFRVYARGEARERNNPFPFTYLSRLRVDFQWENDRWLVTDYQRGP